MMNARRPIPYLVAIHHLAYLALYDSIEDNPFGPAPRLAEADAHLQDLHTVMRVTGVWMPFDDDIKAEQANDVALASWDLMDLARADAIVPLDADLADLPGYDRPRHVEAHIHLGMAGEQRWHSEAPTAPQSPDTAPTGPQGLARLEGHSVPWVAGPAWVVGAFLVGFLTGALAFSAGVL